MGLVLLLFPYLMYLLTFIKKRIGMKTNMNHRMKIVNNIYKSFCETYYRMNSVQYKVTHFDLNILDRSKNN